MDMCQYVMKNYSDVGDFKLHDENDVIKYNEYASKSDKNFLDISTKKENETKISELQYWANEFGWDLIKSELKFYKIGGIVSIQY